MAQGAFTLASAQTHDTGDPTKGSEHDAMLVNDEVNRFITMTNGDVGSHVVTEVVYISAADTVKKADADAAGTADGVAFATATVAASASGLYQMHGVLGGFAGLTAGSKYYVSATAGAITSTKPTTNPCFVGVAISTTELMIMLRGVLLITTAEIADNAVTGVKIALGSDAQGDVMFYNGTDWARLAAGTSGQALKTQGAGANPLWGGVLAAATTGSYAGDGTTTNKVIAHSLAVTPKLVVIWRSNATGAIGQQFIMSSSDNGAIMRLDGAIRRTGLTAMDATNFYVGDGTNWADTANDVLTYSWVAFG